MASRSLVWDILVLGLRFVLLLPLCLYLWWQLLPAYAWLIGQLGAGALVNFFDVPINALMVEPLGLFKTGTELIYISDGVERRLEFGMLATNVAPFIALVLATPGLTWSRRGKALIIGCLFLAIAHIGFLLTAYKVNRAELPVAFGQLCITLPFPLWIALAYWDRIMTLLGAGPRKPKREKREVEPESGKEH